jgi:hypothetical protein
MRLGSDTPREGWEPPEAAAVESEARAPGAPTTWFREKAGWYPDPTSRHRLRYRGDSGWTAWVADDAGALRDAEGVPAELLPGGSWEEAGRRLRRWDRIKCWVTVLGIGVIGGFATLIVAALAGVGEAFRCEEGGGPCGHGGFYFVLLSGFGLIIVSTVLVVLNYRRRREAEDSGLPF